jgi:hypothetical protein
MRNGKNIILGFFLLNIHRKFYFMKQQVNKTQYVACEGFQSSKYVDCGLLGYNKLLL